MTDQGVIKITVQVSVARGESCRIETDSAWGICQFYRSRSCLLFNKVIVDHVKCTQCKEVT